MVPVSKTVHVRMNKTSRLICRSRYLIFLASETRCISYYIEYDISHASRTSNVSAIELYMIPFTFRPQAFFVEQGNKKARQLSVKGRPPAETTILFSTMKCKQRRLQFELNKETMKRTFSSKTIVLCMFWKSVHSSFIGDLVHSQRKYAYQTKPGEIFPVEKPRMNR